MARKHASTPRRHLARHLWTLVQHSAWASVKRDKMFMGGLEEASVTEGSKLAQRIAAAGGKLFDDYGTCSDEAHKFMYPEDYEGIIPVADRCGEFNPRIKVDGRRVFVPKTQEDTGNGQESCDP